MIPDYIPYHSGAVHGGSWDTGEKHSSPTSRLHALHTLSALMGLKDTLSLTCANWHLIALQMIPMHQCSSLLSMPTICYLSPQSFWCECFWKLLFLTSYTVPDKALLFYWLFHWSPFSSSDSGEQWLEQRPIYLVDPVLCWKQWFCPNSSFFLEFISAFSTPLDGNALAENLSFSTEDILRNL